MIGIQLVETVGNGRFEGRKLVIVFRVQAFLLDEFPQPFNQVEVGGVSRQKQQFNIQPLRTGKHCLTALVLGIVQDQRDRYFEY